MLMQQQLIKLADSFDYGVIDISDEMKDLKWLYTTLTRIKKDFIIFRKD